MDPRVSHLYFKILFKKFFSNATLYYDFHHLDFLKKLGEMRQLKASILNHLDGETSELDAIEVYKRK